MTEREKQFIEYWQKKRQTGIYKYSIITGFTYAVFVLIFSKLLAWNFQFTKQDLYASAFAILIGILVLGPFMWWHRERKYNKLIEANKKSKNKKNKKKG